MTIIRGRSQAIRGMVNFWYCLDPPFLKSCIRPWISMLHPYCFLLKCNMYLIIPTTLFCILVCTAIPTPPINCFYACSMNALGHGEVSTNPGKIPLDRIFCSHLSQPQVRNYQCVYQKALVLKDFGGCLGNIFLRHFKTQGICTKTVGLFIINIDIHNHVDKIPLPNH